MMQNYCLFAASCLKYAGIVLKVALKLILLVLLLIRLLVQWDHYSWWRGVAVFDDVDVIANQAVGPVGPLQLMVQNSC